MVPVIGGETIRKAQDSGVGDAVVGGEMGTHVCGDRRDPSAVRQQLLQTVTLPTDPGDVIRSVECGGRTSDHDEVRACGGRKLCGQAVEGTVERHDQQGTVGRHQTAVEDAGGRGTCVPEGVQATEPMPTARAVVDG